MVFLCCFGFVYMVKQKRRGALHTMGQGGVVAAKSVSHHHHHHHSASKTTKQRRVYEDTGITEMGWAMGAYGDTRVREMD